MYRNKSNEVFKKGEAIPLLKGGYELNPSARSNAYLAKKCGIYKEESSEIDYETERLGEFEFDDKTGTCKRKVIKLTLEEAKSRKLQRLKDEIRMKFEELKEQEVNFELFDEPITIDKTELKKKYKALKKQVEDAQGLEEVKGVE